MKKKPVKIDSYNVVLVICTGCLLAYVATKHKWLLNASIIIAILAIVSKQVANIISFCWMKLADVLGLVMPNIILSIIFFIVLTPIAFFSRVLGKKDPLDLKNSTQTYFKDVTTKFDSEYFERPW